MTIKESDLDQIETLIRSGNQKKALELLERLSPQNVPARLVLRASNLLVRAGLEKMSARILHPVMFNDHVKPEAKIAAQYALTLQQLGAYNEALRILEKIDFEKVAEANLFYAFGLMTKWEYEAAVPYLRSYLKFAEITVYQSLVAKTNLAQALILSNQLENVEDLLSEVFAEAEKNKFLLLAANSLELRAQLLFVKGQFLEALEFLNSSDQKLESSPERYKLMVEYWKVICNYSLNPTKKEAVSSFLELRKKSVDRGFWSVVRECDFQRAVIEGNPDLFLKVYFGTPFLNYRKKLKSAFPQVEIPETYLWNPTQKTPKKVADRFKVTEGEDVSSGAKLKKGQLSHRLMQSLTSDFYIPFRTESLFGYVFPDEHYNPVSSYKKTSNAINRLQNWLEKSEIPIQIRFKDGGYRIFLKDPYLLEVRIQTFEDRKTYDTRAEILRVLASGAKTSKEISALLDIPLRSVSRYLSDLAEDGKISSSNNQFFRKPTDGSSKC